MRSFTHSLPWVCTTLTCHHYGELLLGAGGKGPEAGTGRAEKQGRATRRAAPRPWVHARRARAAPLGLSSPSR